MANSHSAELSGQIVIQNSTANVIFHFWTQTGMFMSIFEKSETWQRRDDMATLRDDFLQASWSFKYQFDRSRRVRTDQGLCFHRILLEELDNDVLNY